MTEQKAKKYFEWFLNRDFPETELTLGPGEKIINIKKFVESHLPIAKKNWRKKTYLPYVLRLNFVKEYFESKT